MQDDFNSIITRLTENARHAVQKADFYSKTYNKGNMGTDHLLLGLLSVDTCTGARLLHQEGVTFDDFERLLPGLPDSKVSMSAMEMMSLSEACVIALRTAGSFVEDDDPVGTEHILLAIITQRKSRATLMLQELDVNIEHLVKEVKKTIDTNRSYADRKRKREQYKSASDLRWLSHFGEDITILAKEGKLDTVIGRDSEIERTITVLGRRTKSNPVLIGEAGVGKTAIVEGLAIRIAKNDVPSDLIGKRIFQIDLSSMVAGTRLRGEFEERIKGVVDEAIEHPEIILFIDELHVLSGAGNGEGAMDAANILKPALARGKISVIGATTMDEYRRYIEKDKALARRFQTVQVNEPSPEVSLRILKGIKGRYEKHHSVEIPDEILESAIDMSRRYISDRFLPDKAIDLVDEASAICKVDADRAGGGKLKKMRIEVKDIEEKMVAAAEEDDFEKAALLKTDAEKLKKSLKQLEKDLGEKVELPVVTEEQLAKAVSLKTGIPVSRVHGDELELLTKLEEHIDKAIIGQDEAVHAVAKAIRRGRSGVANPKRPIGSFLFMGPTGVGKTELARVLAREVFGGEDALIKIDMSELGEKHNVSRLVGAPAGYVGYDDGGKLTESVRRHPYSVVLFDEIEKADPDVFNLFLQILEDGQLTDGQGNAVKFNNTVIIMTSNLGSRDMFEDDSFGFSSKTLKKDKKSREAEYELQKTSARRALEQVMRPELINRLDAVLVFHPLTESQVSQIFTTMLDDLRKRLMSKGVGVRVSDDVRKYICEIGYDPKNGARPLRRAIEDNLETLIADRIIAGELEKGDTAVISLGKDKKLKLDVEHE